MDSAQVSRKFQKGQCVRVHSAKDCRGNPKFTAWQQYIGLEGMISYSYHDRYGPLFVDGIVSCDEVLFYDIVCDDDFRVSVPEDMLEGL
jgi:hypothetical protein